MVIASRNLATATVLHNVATSLMKAINNVASIIMTFTMSRDVDAPNPTSNVLMEIVSHYPSIVMAPSNVQMDQMSLWVRTEFLNVASRNIHSTMTKSVVAK
jgi:hypothetical protein